MYDKANRMRAEATHTLELSNQKTRHVPVILLVEDESIVREVTREVLVHAGYSVLESSTPAEALEMASRHKDATRLRALQPSVVIVFMSGYAEADVMQDMKQNSTIHIQKPFTVNMLLSRVEEALQAGVAVG